jgi:plastocyanin
MQDTLCELTALEGFTMAVERAIPGARSEESSEVADVALGTRSTAMWLMPIAAIVEALLTIDAMISVGLLAPFVVITVVLVGVAVLGFVRPRPRVFMTGGILLLAYTALIFPFADGLIHPIGSSHAWTDIIGIVAGLTGAIAGFAAFVELRRGRPLVRALSSPIGEGLAILIVGVLLGTSYVSISGFGTLAASPGLGVTNGVLMAPTQPPIELDAPGTTFTQKTLQLSTGPGTIYVVNTDAVPHTFDIEIDGRHVSYPVPSHSTTAVVLNLASAGGYTYWCAIPGHRPTMEGTLEVAES